VCLSLCGGRGVSGSSNEGHAEAATDVLLEKLGGSTAVLAAGAERGACVALGTAAGWCHPCDRERRAAALTTLRAR
jgi:hypothetical protein